MVSVEDIHPISLTLGTKNVQTFSWSPDGKTIAFVMEDETNHVSPVGNKEKASVNRLWTIEAFSQNPIPKPWTSDEYCVRGFGDIGSMYTEFDWSPDGTKIAFAHSPSSEFDSFCLDSSIAILDLSTGNIIPWEKHSLYEASPRYSPDGEHIAYIITTSSRRYGGSKRIAIRTENGQKENLLANTSDESPHLLGRTENGTHLIICEPKSTKYHLVLLKRDGSSAREIDTGHTSFRELSLNYNRNTLGMIIQSSTTPPEAYICPLDHFAPIQISHLNEDRLSFPQAQTKTITWKSSDGLMIEGLFTYPIGYEEGKQYPLLVIIHGGPSIFFNETFIGNPDTYQVASFAQAGFAVLRPNPRGSSGYGHKFLHANQQDWGGMDFIDIMSGIDFVISQGIAAPERLGIMGWSYGGYMTAWAITQTSRFKAASIGAGITNLVSMNGTTDLHRFLTEYLGEFTDNPTLYEQRSPLYHVSNVSTPCLIQHGGLDLRVPVSQAYEFYRALERLKKPVELALYPEIGHGIEKPQIKLKIMEQNLEWFQKHLQ
jgi:dipeptidyl aminopeptidase/acylaminoacyl peptidase